VGFDPTESTWRKRLARAWRRSKSHPVARYAQLATVAPSGKPRNRTIVVRRLDLERDELVFATDFRSAKAGEVADRPAAELCWYFAGLREQFRLQGTFELAGPGHERGADRLALWQSMSAKGRAVFAWPPPGTDRSDGDEYPAVHSSPEPPAHFALGVLCVDEVDWLSLGGSPHERLHFGRDGNGVWHCRRVRP